MQVSEDSLGVNEEPEVSKTIIAPEEAFQRQKAYQGTRKLIVVILRLSKKTLVLQSRERMGVPLHPSQIQDRLVLGLCGMDFVLFCFNGSSKLKLLFFSRLME